MRLKSLMKYGIPEMIIRAWTERQDDYLLPLQERAVREGLLPERGKDPENFLISAPTSSGKSFCGEMAAMGSLLNRQKVVMLFPLKSITEEKYRYFRECYDSLGIRTIIVTGDHPENDPAFEQGEFDLALAIYEKFNRLLTVNLDILGQLGLIVVDEFQMLSEERRGAELELSLMKVLGSGYTPRIVALSAVLNDEAELLEWLEAKLIKERVRPVDLRQGIVSEGIFRYRSFNSGIEGTEPFPLRVEQDDIAGALLEYLGHDEKQNLVFLKSRRDTINASFKLAGRVSWKEASETLEMLADEEPSYMVRSLKQTLSRGVAFHNADLTPRQRQAVEQGYRAGEIRTIFSTPTLAMGVNLPAETVFLETVRYRSGEFGGKPYPVPITVAEYQNITGRAGRYDRSRKNNYGRAVVLAGSPFEHEVLWSGYIEQGIRERIRSAVEDDDLSGMVLELLVSGTEPGRDGIKRALGRGFRTFRGDWPEDEAVDRALAELGELALIDPSGLPAPAGAAVAESGLSVPGYRRYRVALKERMPESLIGWLVLALTAEDAEIVRSCLTGMEFQQRVHEKRLFREGDADVGEISHFIGAELGRIPLDYHQASILKGALTLRDWAGMAAVERLEQCYQLHLGQILGLGETAAWLLTAIARILAARDCSSRVPEVLENNAFAVQFGIAPELRELHRRFGNRLKRAEYACLRRDGLIGPADLVKAGEKYLAKLIGPERRLKNLLTLINNPDKEDLMNGANIQSVIPKGGTRGRNYGNLNYRPALVELDGRYERERYLVKVDGAPVRLTGKSFKYLAKLAGARLLSNEGWIYKDDIEAGFNQARYLYRLKQEMNRDGGVAWSIFENNRLGYYRLDVDSSRVKINLSNLRDHPDFELRELADRLAPRLAG